MIRTRIWGGLGNQMFQFIVGYSMAREKNTDLILDTSYFYKSHHNKRITRREIGLFQFPSIKKQNFKTTNRKSYVVAIMQIPVINFLARQIHDDYFLFRDYILETQYRYHERLFHEYGSDFYLDGYWHCDKYFSEIRSEVMSLFSFEDEQIMSEYYDFTKFGDNTVAIHVRRGDYISQNNPNAMGEDYYRKAMEYIAQRIENPTFCFFSDDILWTKDTFSDVSNAIIANEKRILSDVQELQLMRMCKHQIISNSSYSWWGAWLNNNTDKIVIAPKVWKNKRDMMPESWILV